MSIAPRGPGRPKGSGRRLFSREPSLAQARRNRSSRDASGEPDAVGIERPASFDLEREVRARQQEEPALKTQARLLCLSDYARLFDAEYAHNLALCGQGYQLPPSTYRERLTGERAEVYDARLRRQKRDEMAIALHANNMRTWSPSLLARSIRYFKSTTATVAQLESGQRRLASRPSTLQTLRFMRDMWPAPSWPAATRVNAFGFDQTYEFVGVRKHGQRTTVEQHDAHGMPVRLESSVYINSIRLHLPSTLGQLSASDLAQIAANHGSPYTEDYNLVLVPLQPATVMRSLFEFAEDALSSIETGAGNTPLQQLTLRQIGTFLFGRRAISPGGPSAFDILEALRETNTMSHEDWRKIAEHLAGHSDPECAVLIGIPDGQSVMLMKNGKVKFPHLYNNWLIGVGGFHEHFHSMAATEEMFEEAFGCCCKSALRIECVPKVVKDMGHNMHSHLLNVNHVQLLAILAYLIQDVRSPSPRLLLRDFPLYCTQVQHAGGIVLTQALLYKGFPALQWLRTGRGGDGRRLVQLFAYSLHLYRSVCHKPVAAQIVLVGLLGFCCSLPALQSVLIATVSLSLLGRWDANMYTDRLLEYINKMQQGLKGDSSATSFGHALDMTTLLRAMLHVRHAFDSAEAGHEPSEDPLTPSQLVQARLLQDMFLRKCGRDLTIPHPDNPFWHTGSAVPLNGGDLRARRPWEWIWRVAEGRSRGKNRAAVETWVRYVRRFVFEHFFPY